MSTLKSRRSVFLFVCSVSLIAAAVTAVLISGYHNRKQFQLLSVICQNIIEEQPEAEQTVLAVLKEYKSNPAENTAGSLLCSFGYRKDDFPNSGHKNIVIFTVAGFLSGVLLFLTAFWFLHRKEILRIEELTDYLERVNHGNSGLLLPEKDDEFGRLQDEIYKTVTFACQTRDAALTARQNFADNLSNIAHQLKTPVTAISLSVQMMNEPSAVKYQEQIRRQLQRLTHLEDALLLLARLDSGTLSLKRESIDVFTVLNLAADNLQEIFVISGISVDIPEMGEIRMWGDLDWTMEVIMNLMKNCGEHMPEGGTIHCSCEQNPLYTQIRIWDEGPGFESEEIPHLFERFYRGKHAKEGGIGIGLALAKEILERQQGTVRARNLPDGGACFELRIYAS